MKNVQLKSLTLINFKGIKEMTVNFNHLTSIFGANGLGKTTIFDAFTWLLWGKDSAGSKDFNIKTLDSNSNPIYKLDHEVTGVLIVNETEITLKRGFKEKWVKKKGSEEAEFSGHETLYFFNDVPCQAGEYQGKISSIIDENIFKLITSPLYFNSLKWQERRSVLNNIAGEVSDAEIAENRPEFQTLLAILIHKSSEEYKREIAAKKKKAKEEIETIPTRISEVQRGMAIEPDYASVNIQIQSLTEELSKIDNQITDKSQVSQALFDASLEIQKEINALKTKLQQIEFDAKQDFVKGSQEVQTVINEKQSKVNSCRSNLQNLTNDYTLLQERIKYLSGEITTHSKRRDALLADWYAENEKTIEFKDDEFICPACNRAFEVMNIEERKEEMIAHFNINKLEKQNAISKQGQGVKAIIKTLQDELDEKTAKQTVLYRDLESARIFLREAETANVNTPIAPYVFIPTAEYKEIQGQISVLENKPKSQPADVSDLKRRKPEIQVQIDDLKKQLNIKESIEKAKSRILELTNEEKKLAQQLADLEKQEFVILDFEKAKIDKVEEKVNQMFSYVQFKMFQKNINGGIEPCCDTLINGVPWSDANNAARVNGGLDIIRTLCKFHGVTAPVFADNSESVNQLLSLDSQLVRLVVTHDEQLKVA
jgi:DNA repair protein SbcC/Rad50